MCKTAGRCVAIILVLVGFFIGVGGILTILVPEFLDCNDFDWEEFFNNNYDFCRNYKDTFRIAGGVGTAIGGGMLLIGIIMLCLLRSQPRQIVHRAPALTVQMQPQQLQHQQTGFGGAAPSAPPNSPYPNQQYQNPLAYQNQGYQNTQYDYHQSYPNPPPYYNQGYEKNPQGLPRAHVGYGQGGAPPSYQY